MKKGLSIKKFTLAAFALQALIQSPVSYSQEHVDRAKILVQPRSGVSGVIQDLTPDTSKGGLYQVIYGGLAIPAGLRWMRDGRLAAGLGQKGRGAYLAAVGATVTAAGTGLVVGGGKAMLRASDPVRDLLETPEMKNLGACFGERAARNLALDVHAGMDAPVLAQRHARVVDSIQRVGSGDTMQEYLVLKNCGHSPLGTEQASTSSTKPMEVPLNESISTGSGVQASSAN